MGLKENLWTVDKIKHTLTKHGTQGRAETLWHTHWANKLHITAQVIETKNKVEMSQWEASPSSAEQHPGGQRDKPPGRWD